MSPRVILPLVDDAPDDAAVSRFDVERYACGELSAERRLVVEAAMATDPALKAFLDDVVASDAAFLMQQPVARFSAKIASTNRPSVWAQALTFFSGRGVAVLSAAAAAAVVVVVAVARPGLDRPIAGTDVVAAPVVDAGLRSKGGAAHVGFFVKSAAGARPGTSGERLRAGDQIQLAVKDADRAAMVVVGVDGTGAVAVYARETVDTQSKGDQSARLLPASLILDDTAGAERFFVVYGDTLDATVAAAMAAAESLGKAVAAHRVDLAATERLDLDDARLVQASVHILKVR